MEGRYNTRSPAVKRLMKEAQELSEPTDQYYAQPLEDNLFEWHFTVRGPADSEFQNGIYHGRIILPVDYPMKPPSIIWLTPNGRFETNKKICLSISGHHPESWQPSWSIRTALLAIIGFMPTHGGGAIGSLDYTADERKLLAKKSREWKCPSCSDIQTILLEPSPESKSTSEEVQKLASQIKFQSEESKKSNSADSVSKASTTSDKSSKTANKPQRSSSYDTAPASRPSQPSQSQSATSYTWDPSQPPRMFNPWAMPAYPNMGGFPLHPAHPSAAVGMMPRFPFPPGHPQHRDNPFYMPGFPLPPSALGRQPPMNPAMFHHMNQGLATPCNTPDTSRSSPVNSSKSEKELSNKHIKIESSPTQNPTAVEEVKTEPQNETDTSESTQAVIGAEAAPTESPITDSKKIKNTETSGLRQRSIAGQAPTEGVPTASGDDRPSEGSNDAAAAGDTVRQRSRPAPVNPVAQQNETRETSGRPRNFDYTSVLLVVLSVCTLLILLKRVFQYVIAGQM